jgi:hypothetical protein
MWLRALVDHCIHGLEHRGVTLDMPNCSQMSVPMTTLHVLLAGLLMPGLRSYVQVLFIKRGC